MRSCSVSSLCRRHAHDVLTIVRLASVSTAEVISCSTRCDYIDKDTFHDHAEQPQNQNQNIIRIRIMFI